MDNDLPLRAVQRRSLESRATDEIRSAIIMRRYAPGSRLTEMQLSELLGISRGTVRAALQKLHTEGLVAQRPYAAWEVTGLTADDAWELFTLRGALEGLAAELVADLIGRKSLDPASLNSAFEELRLACDDKDIKTANIADFAFHKLVVTSANHGRLLTQYERVDAQIRMLIVAGNEPPDTVEHLVQEHEPLMTALLSGRPDLAGIAFRNHSIEAGRETAERMRSLDVSPES